MPRYKVKAIFGPWSVGEEFESTDGWHAKLATKGTLLEVVPDKYAKSADSPSEGEST